MTVFKSNPDSFCHQCVSTSPVLLLWSDNWLCLRNTDSYGVFADMVSRTYLCPGI